MKIKMLIHVTETKPDLYGNTYRTARITNTRTGKTTPEFKTCSAGNVQSVASDLTGLNRWPDMSTTTSSTGSARLKSLPEAVYMKPADLAGELRVIGFKVPKNATARGCL
jgi:hypothetical protein